MDKGKGAAGAGTEALVTDNQQWDSNVVTPGGSHDVPCAYPTRNPAVDPRGTAPGPSGQIGSSVGTSSSGRAVTTVSPVIARVVSQQEQQQRQQQRQQQTSNHRGTKYRLHEHDTVWCCDSSMLWATPMNLLCFKKVGGHESRLEREMLDSLTGPTNLQLRLHETYYHMQSRWWARMTSGSFGQMQQFSWFWLFLYISSDIVYAFLADKGKIAQIFFVVILSVLFAFFTPRYRWVTRVILFEVFLFVILFLLLKFNGQWDKVAIWAASLVAGVLLTYASFRSWPFVVRMTRSCYRVKGPVLVEENLEAGDFQTWEFSQASIGGLCAGIPLSCLPPPVTFRSIYKGPLSNGRPHGFGRWTDNGYRGEHLVGYWNHGIPIGPFDSEEVGSGNVFKAVQLIFCTNGTGFVRKPISYGLATVECSVSGEFLNGFPLVDLVRNVRTCTCSDEGVLCFCVKKLVENDYKHMDDIRELTTVTVTIDNKTKGLSINRHKPESQGEAKVTISVEELQSSLRLTLDPSWTTTHEAEGILFIHGYNHDQNEALQRYGQLLALGSFPSYIRPFLFGWPAGTDVGSYFCAQSAASDHAIHRDLGKYIGAITRAGIKNLHVVVHSMGTRLFFRSFPIIQNRFNARFNNDSETGDHIRRVISVSDNMPNSQTSESRANLLTLTMLNPDYELDTFKEYDFPEVRRFCDGVTLYADKRDCAISCAHCLTGLRETLGSTVRRIYDNGRPLDIDIIDTSDLEYNMSGLYHSYFNVNRSLVDDLYELIVTGKRADARKSRLVNRDGHFRFSVVPASVVFV